MKRILVALFLLVISVSVSLFGTEILSDKLETLSKKTESVINDTSSANELLDLWKKSEKTFALILNNEKYAKLEANIKDLKNLSDREFLVCCYKILYEIEEIQDSQLFLIENIL